VNISSRQSHPTGPTHTHPGPCSGVRGRCWRPECQREFGDFKPIEFLPNNSIVASCHQATYASINVELAVELYRHAGQEREGVPWAA